LHMQPPIVVDGGTRWTLDHLSQLMCCDGRFRSRVPEHALPSSNTPCGLNSEWRKVDAPNDVGVLLLSLLRRSGPNLLTHNNANPTELTKRSSQNGFNISISTTRTSSCSTHVNTRINQNIFRSSEAECWESSFRFLAYR